MIIEWDESITLPIFQELYNTDADIILMWGGRYSGKSRNIPHFTVKDSLEVPNSKTILIRKVHDTIKESIYSEYDAFIESNNFYEYGICKKTKSPLEINFSNGSKIIARGCDKPEKIKSVREPDTVVIEEADQITEQDFDYILTTVRSGKKKCKVYLLFNPEFSAKGNWIKKRFFNDIVLAEQDMYGRVYYEKTIIVKDKPIVLKILALHSTYENNAFAPPERIAMIEEFKDIDINKYNVWAKGLWGESQIEKPYIGTFDKMKHIGKFSFDNSDILLSFDFNVDPMTCTASQYQNGKVVFVAEYKRRDSWTGDLCEYINARLPKSNRLIVTGDASGKNRSANTKGGLNCYHTIQEYLKISDFDFIIPSHNFSIINSREIVQKAFYRGHVMIDESCTNLINDLTYCEADMNGKLVKKSTGTGKELSHFMDNMTYAIVNKWNEILQL
jgi:PBSX family phage terminase large subunit